TNAGAAAQRMRIMPTGEIGIGTTTPQAALDVNGGVRIGNTSTCVAGSAGTLRWTGSAVEVCNGGSWIAIGSGGGGSGTTMASGFPDAIYCSYDATTFAWAYLMYRYADGRMYYQYPPSTSYYVIFNASGTYNTHAGFLNGGSMNCTNRSIATLYTEGKAYNFVGGGGTSGGSSGTNASMISGFPDAIVCPRTDSGDNIFYILNSGTSNEVLYSVTGTDWVIRYNKTTGAFISGTGTSISTFISGAANHCLNSSTNIASLYSTSRAFNLGASSALASGTAGGVQFSGGSNLLSDTANFFWDNTNKRLGISVAAPVAKLDVNGVANIWSGSRGAVANNYMSAGSLTVGNIAANFGGGSSWNANTAGLMLETLDNTEIAVHDSGHRVASLMYFEGAGNNRITIGRDMGWGAISNMLIRGNVGVGNSITTPVASLDVSGGIKVGNDTGCNALKYGMLSWSSGTTLQVCTSSGMISLATAVLTTAAGTNGQVQFNSSGALGASSSLFWDNTNSRLGIGTNTPFGRVTMVDTYLNTATSVSSALPGLSVIGSGSDIIGLTVWDRDANGGTVNDGDATLYFGDDTTDSLRIAYAGASAAMTERMRIEAGGNVGIGTATPGALGDGATPRYLHVHQTGGQSVLGLTTNLTTAATGAGSISFGTTGTAGAEKRTAVISSTMTAASAATVTGDMNFWTTNAGAAAQRMRIMPTGEIGIGTTTPQAALDVNGGVRIGTTSTCVAGSAGTLRWTGSAVEVCNGGSWISIGSGGGGTGTSMVAGFPDMIRCNVTSPNWGQVVFALAYAPNVANGLYYYRGLHSQSYDVIFNANGTFNSYTSITTSDCNVSIASLYASGKAYNFVGGGGTSGGSAGTNASMISGWPDTLSCSGANGSVVLAYAWKSAAGSVTYLNDGDYGGSTTSNAVVLTFATPTSSGVLTEGTGWTGWATDCGSKTIATLYSGGQAFNLAASSAVASGVSGAMQFSGGSNLLSDAANFFWDNTNKRLGIGTNAPFGRLSLESTYLNTATSGSNWPGLGIMGSASDVVGLTVWDRDGSGGTTNDGDGTLYFGDDTTDSLRFAYAGSTLALAERMRIEAGGNVGIGTTTPQTRLDVNGGIKVGNDTGCNALKYGMLSWSSGTTLQVCTSSGMINLATAAGVVAAIGNVGEVQFNNSNGAFMADSNFFWDNTNKRLGLGSNTPQARLMVRAVESTTLTNYTGAINNAGILIDTDYTANAYTPGLYWRTSNNNPSIPKAGIYLQETSAGTIMRLGTSNNYATGLTSHVTIDQNGNLTATSVFHTSDARLKDKVKTVKGLEIIRKLRGVSFVWKDSGKEALGFIAQEVEGIVPMAVKTDANGMKSVDYNMMIAPLVEAMKELDSEVTVLKAENAALKARVESLEGTVKSLEDRLKAIEEKLGATVH
ncbi:MAG: hypothetical protein EBQ96_05925, partial [Proteobacteria bacterium]|nr:hypothetical protein [Pseudomonadota bacterium]